MGKLLFHLRLPIATCLVICNIPSTVVAVVQIVTFNNPSPIVIPAGAPGVTSGPAAPFPSTIDIGESGTINDVKVHIHGISHTFPNDIGGMLVGPGGQGVPLFVRPGGGEDIVDLDWTFDDSAADPLPDSGQLESGTFVPSNHEPSFNFDAPAPASPSGTALSVFDGTDLLGPWNLYVQDFIGGDTGNIAEGWSLEIEYTPAAAVVAPEPLSIVVWSLLGLATVGAIQLRSWNWRATGRD